MMVDYCYVYAIVRGEVHIPPKLTGLADAPLATIACQDLAAVVSGAQSSTLPATPDYVLSHEAVVEALGQSAPTLPVRFGTVLAGKTAVAQAIAGQYDVLLADLVRVGDKVELGLTILWDLPTEQARAYAKQQTTPTQAPASGTSGAGTRYWEARLAHYQREATQQDQARAVITHLESALGSCVLEQRYRTLASPRLAVRAAYLVQLWQIQETRRIVDGMREKLPDLHWLLCGPWPPYSFVTGAGKLFFGRR